MFFGLTEHQEEATYSLGYKLPLKRNSDSSFLNETNAINFDKIRKIGTEWYVPHPTPGMEEEKIFFRQISIGYLQSFLM